MPSVRSVSIDALGKITQHAAATTRDCDNTRNFGETHVEKQHMLQLLLIWHPRDQWNQDLCQDVPGTKRCESHK